MSKNSIDKLFKDRLANIEEPYPEHLWSNVARGISGEQKRRGAIWYSWLLGALLLIGLGGGLYLYLTGDGLDTDSVNTHENRVPTHKGQEAAKATDTENASAYLETDKLDEELTNNSPDSESSSTNTNQNVTLIDMTNNNTLSSSHKSNQLNSESSENEATKLISSNDGWSSSLIGTGDGEGNSNGLDERLEDQNVGETTDDIKNNTALEFPGSSVFNESNMIPEKRNARPATELIQAYRNTRGLQALEEDSDMLTRVNPPVLEPYSKKRFVGHWAVAPVYGVDFASRSMTSKGAFGEALINQRESEEKLVNAFTTGLELQLSVRKLALTTGLYYSQMNERVNYILEGTEQTIDGKPVIGDLERSVVNRHQMVMVPIHLSYRFSKGPWALEPYVGVNIGLSMKSSGELFDYKSLSYISYDETSQNNPYNDTPGLSYQGGLALCYRSGFGQEWFLRSSYRLFNDTFTKDDYAIDQNYSSLGLMLGCRFKL